MKTDQVNVTSVVSTVADLVAEHYVFADVAGQLSDLLRQQLAAGAYDGLSPEDLCREVTTALRSLNGDKHLRLEYVPGNRAAGAGGQATDDDARMEKLKRWEQQLPLGNFGFQRIEYLPGGVAYVDVRQFAPPSLGGETAAAVMALAANAQALIFDLTNCRGGHLGMVAFLTTYLLADDHHLNTFVTRDSDQTIQSWTYGYVPGRRLDTVPVFVVTSARTFSGGEEFAYNLQSLQRAVIVGETTAGAAHPGRLFPAGGGFTVFVPHGRPVNTVTGTNWEGVGVVPDVPASEEEAVSMAHALALERIVAGSGSPFVREEAETALAELRRKGENG